MKLSKIHLEKIGQSGGFLVGILGLLLKTGLLLLENILKPLAKSVLIPLGLTAAASPKDAATHKKKKLGLGNTTLIIMNEEMNDKSQIVKSLEEFDLFTKRFSETMKNKAKEQQGIFLSMLLGILVASLLGYLLTGKGTMRADEGTIKTGEGTIRADQDF